MKRACALGLLLGCACPDATLVQIDTETDRYTFCVTVAETEAARRAGLRGRDALAPGEGLLLSFPVQDELCIVNSGVVFDLDVLYAAADGTVVAIERGVPAGDPAPRCHAGAQRVLEVGAGELSAVEPGARLSTP